MQLHDIISLKMLHAVQGSKRGEALGRHRLLAGAGLSRKPIGQRHGEHRHQRTPSERLQLLLFIKGREGTALKKS